MCPPEKWKSLSVNYTIYAAKILSRGEESWKEIASDIAVRKLNTFCYLVIMLGSASRLFIYLAFHPSLRKCRCRCLGGGRSGRNEATETEWNRSSQQQQQQQQLQRRSSTSSTRSSHRNPGTSLRDDEAFTTANPRLLQLAQSSFRGKFARGTQ